MHDENLAQLSGKRVVIAGGRGFIGHALTIAFSQAGARVTVLARKPSDAGDSTPNVAVVAWDGRTLGPWSDTLDGADALVNLCGRSVDCIKSPDHCDQILRSRVETTRLLGKAIRTVDAPPPVWAQMSTAHIYGDPPTAICTEDSAFGVGLAPLVGQAWEQAFAESKLPQQRGVVLRTSFVVGRNRGGGAGALGMLGWLARIGLGGRVGGGTQGMSWIHEADMVQLFARAITNTDMTGAYIASAPSPVSQVQFMQTLRRVLGQPVGLPATEWMVRFGAYWLLRTDPELALYGRYVVSNRLAEEQYQFRFSELEPALRDIYSSS